ncbi:hypothetical protein SAY87_026423 [Trapa incisa]|uniref:adenylate dimethylallyltransferase (ADP/ATP-dependent) n=1 Tax=Trapa incisa TaxID=236973 RepID=A0AAN7JL18_9MYRT|nr:hypothetical protein SAY87_026423 [Trapa incisa]
MIMSITKIICKLTSTRPAVDLSGGHLNRDLLLNTRLPREKVVVILGSTGTGKSKLSVDIASRFPAEIINSDKMQFYRDLDVVTNKISEAEKCGIPHHLMGMVDPDEDFTPEKFCEVATLAIGSIRARGQLPIIAGGSNSYIEALIPSYDKYYYQLRPVYDFCFLWVDVDMPVLHKFVSDRVDLMVKKGLVDEVREMFDPNADYSRGVRRAIGVPELDLYFRTEKYLSRSARGQVLAEAIKEIKNNTCKLACRQLEKIHRLRDAKGWKLHRLDATEVFRKRGEEADRAWEELVAGIGAEIVAEFLYNHHALLGGGGLTYDDHPLSGIRFPRTTIETGVAALIR